MVGLRGRLQILPGPGMQVHGQHAQHEDEHSQIVFHFVPPRELLKRAWFFRTSILSVTPFRSLTRCAEPAVLGFIPRYFLMGYGNKMPVRLFTLVRMSERTCHRSRSIVSVRPNTGLTDWIRSQLDFTTSPLHRQILRRRNPDSPIIPVQRWQNGKTSFRSGLPVCPSGRTSD